MFCLVCVCLLTNMCWMYPKVQYVLREVIGLLNSSNAMAVPPLEFYFVPPQHPRRSFALILTFPKAFTMETLSICEKHPEALTSILAAAPRSLILVLWPISWLRISAHSLLPRLRRLHARSDCIRIDWTPVCGEQGSVVSTQDGSHDRFLRVIQIPDRYPCSCWDWLTSILWCFSM